MLNDTFNELVDIWAHDEHVDKKINLLDEDGTPLETYLDEDGFPFYLKSFEITEFDNGKDYAAELLVMNNKEDYYISPKDYIGMDELISSLIEHIAEHLGLNLDDYAQLVIRTWA